MTRSPGNEEITAELVRRARRGDERALEALVERAYPRVRRWSLVHTGDPAEADDLTQDVLVQVIRSIHTFQGDARFTSWLYAVTRNAALDRLRVARRRGALHAVPDVDAHTRPGRPTTPLREVELEETSGILGAFLRDLPIRLQDVSVAGPSGVGLRTTVSIRPGQTLVLGSSTTREGDRTLFPAVRAELPEG